MRISLLTVGSRGDVQPFIALGRALAARGQAVTLTTHERFAPLAREHGLDFYPLGSDPLALLQSAAGRAWLDSDRNPLALISNMIRLGRPLIEQLAGDTLAALQASDGVVYSLFGNLAFHVAQAKGIPAAMGHLQPVLGRTTAFPVPGSPRWPARLPGIGPVYNWLTFLVAEQIFWQPFRRGVQRWRKETLGLPPISFWGPYRELRRSRHPFLYAYSERVVPRPADWPPWYHITGGWHLPPAAGWRPPRRLRAFLDGGDPPVYVGFGSMTDPHPGRLARLIREALAASGRRALVLRGWAGLDDASWPETILPIDEVPHEWLFPRLSAVVHHGGAGTTAAGLRAGVPGIVIPYFADQHFWGERVWRLGVGPRPIPRRRLNEANLAAALEQTTGDRLMRERAAGLGRELQAEDGAGRAADLILNLFGG